MCDKSVMLAGVAGLSSEVLSVPFECNFDDGGGIPASIRALWMRLATPWIVLMMLVLVFTLTWAAIAWTAQSRRSAQMEERFHRRQLITCLIVITIVTTYFSFIDVVRDLLRAINCIEIEEAEDKIAHDHTYIDYAIETEERRVWAEDTGLVCFKGKHLPVGVVGVMGLLLAFCGIVAIVAWVPLNKRHATKPEFIARYWFLYQAYRQEWYTNAWEATILTRKALIAAVVVFSFHLGSTLQASMCAGILIVCYILHTTLMPFKIPEEHDYVPEYSGDFFKPLRLPKLAAMWVRCNNAVHLNGLESASLTGSIVVFYSAIILHDSNSSTVGRGAMVTFTFAVNALFVAYMLYRLYAGCHVLLDLKLEMGNPGFIATHDNSMSPLNLVIKAMAVIMMHTDQLRLQQQTQIEQQQQPEERASYDEQDMIIHSQDLDTMESSPMPSSGSI